MRALILGTQSFLDAGTKVGSQYLAEGLAQQGWHVDYVPTLSSLFDLIGRQRRPRFRRAWGVSSLRKLTEVAPRLHEWSCKAPFPAHRLFLRQAWQLASYGTWIPNSLREKQFDVCIADMAPNMLLLHQVKARLKICRLNDWPYGFAHDLHPVVMDTLERFMRGTDFKEIWAVSEPLAEYAHGLQPSGTVVMLPNGVELDFAAQASQQPIRHANTAVYVGGLTAWLDFELLVQVAKLSPDWTIDVYAPGSENKVSPAKNLRLLGAIERRDLHELLQQYEVGLIPFKDIEGRLRFVERPLKFYEYIAAGLGVVSTDLGALRSGMGELAQYGQDAKGFAYAMLLARAQARTRPTEFALAFARAHSWHVQGKQMMQRLHQLLY